MTHVRRSLMTRVGLLAASLGVAAGVGQMLWGDDIPGWTGNKQDPATLGAVTIALALVAGGGVLFRSRARTGAQALLAATAITVPAGLGFTTAGRLWYLPGIALLIVAARTLLLAQQLGGAWHALLRRWGQILVATLALLYVFLGITATGVVGTLALLGGAAIVAALWLAPRSGRTATGLLVTGALPFGIVAWWSIVAPLAAAAVIAIGVPQIRHPIARAGR